MVALALSLALLVGIALGALGSGGSILTVPILRYVLGIEAHQAIATSLFVVGTTSLVGMALHARRGRVHWQTGLSFGAAGMLGAYLAGRVAHRVPPAALLLGFGLMLGATAFAMLRRNPDVTRASARKTAAPARRLYKRVLEGCAVGAVTGLVGAGGGFLVVPALIFLEGLPLELAIGTSLLVIALKSFAGLAGFLDHTPIPWALAAAVSAAAAAGSLAGTWLALRIGASGLRAAFGWFVAFVALSVLGRELPPLLGLALDDVPAVALAGAATLLLAGLGPGRVLVKRMKHVT